MSIQRYTIDQDGDLAKSKYGGIVQYSDYLSLEAKYKNLLEASPLNELFMITFISGGVRSHTAPHPYSQIVEILEKYLNDSEYIDVKVYAVKLAKIETSSKVQVTNIKV